MNSRFALFVGVAVIHTLMFSVTSRAEDGVVYFKKPPTPEELAKALKGSSSGKKPSGLNGRGIEWTAGAPSDQQTGADNRQLTPTGGSAAVESGPAVAIPVNFDLGSSEINNSSVPYIDAIAAALTRDPGLKLTVEGHTDSSGDAQRNLMLSWERAFTVFRVLVNKYGISPYRLRPEGKGSSEPIQGVVPSDGINRRVQFRPLS